MHLGLDFSEGWLYASRTTGPQGLPRAVPDLRDPRQLATRLSVQIDAEGALVGEIVDILQSEQPTATVVRDVRDALMLDSPLLSQGSGRHWLAEGVAGLCLKKVRRDLQGLGEGGWTSATLTVPVQAGDEYLQRLASAARLAEIPQFMLVEEPLAIWQFVRASTHVRTAALVIQVGHAGSAVTLIDGSVPDGRIVTTEIIPDLGRRHVERAAAEQVMRCLNSPGLGSSPDRQGVFNDICRNLRREGIDFSGPVSAVRRCAWLIQGRVEEFLLRRCWWENAGSKVRDVLVRQAGQLVEQSGFTADRPCLVILTGTNVIGLDAQLAARFPEAVLWHRPELAAWLPAYGAAMINPGHPSWKPVDSAASPAKQSTPADIGVLILNPVTRQPDLDVLFPAGTEPSRQAVRQYQPQQHGQEMFIIELVLRQAGDPGYRSLVRWQTPLVPRLARPRVELTCNLQADHLLEVIVSGDIFPTVDLRRSISLNDTSVTARETSQRMLLQNTPWRD